MGNIYTAIGLMSGTSMDGVDASIIQSNGEDEFKVVYNEHFDYKNDLFNSLVDLREKITSFEDLKKLKAEIISLEKNITFFNAKVIEDIIHKSNKEVDIIGFHGQTIYHSSEEKITRQLGNGYLLSQLLKKKNNF